jgi:hypothetical protein
MSLHRLFACGVAVSALCSAQALAQQADDGLRLRPLLGIGYSWGGDTIMPVTIVEQPSGTEYKETIKAGAGIDLRAGLEVTLPRSPFAMQLALAYQNDGAGGLDNKHIDFRRVPLELMGYWRVSPQLRLGVGARKSTNASLRFSKNYCNQLQLAFSDPELQCSYGLKSSLGAIVEAEYELTPTWGLRARYATESFKFKEQEEFETTKTIRGDHFGIISVWYLR